MSVTIESIVSPSTEKRLVLGNAQWAASLTAGSTWNKLRVGCRAAMGSTGAALSGTPRFYLGFCSDPVSGFTNGPLSGANCKHYIGTMSQDTSWSWTNSTPDYYVNGSFQQAGKNVLGTETAIGGSSTTLMVAEPTVARRIYMVEIERQVTNWDLRWSTNPAITDQTEASLIQAMEEDDFPTSCIAHGLTSNVSTNVVDEVTDGSLNAICCAWNTAAVTMHISEMSFAIYS
jgi:hypothetical protein